MDMVPGDIEGNLARGEKAVMEAAREGCRLLVFPELWSCSLPRRRLPEMAAHTPRVIEGFKDLARRYGVVLAGSLPEAADGKIYNTDYVIDSNGEIAGEYRKIHLFSLFEENLYFERGKAPLICSTSAGRLGIMICYDLRFPELARRLALEGAEILCVSALWPRERIEHWSLLLRSRAVENQMFAVGCNGCGREGEIRYGGHSAVISPTADVLAEGGDREELVLARLELDQIRAFRERITCFEDRAPESY